MPNSSATIRATSRITGWNRSVAEGAAIKLVQVYSVSRPPAESYVTSLSPAELESIRSRVEAALGGVPVRRFDGTWTGADQSEAPR